MEPQLKILLVDDNVETVELFRFYFDLKGHSVLAASGGKEALELLQDHISEVDVMVIDQHMPGLSGLATVQHIWQRWDTLSIPIVLFTSDHQLTIGPAIAALGVARVAYKPIMPRALLGILFEVVSDSR